MSEAKLCRWFMIYVRSFTSNKEDVSKNSNRGNTPKRYIMQLVLKL